MSRLVDQQLKRNSNRLLLQAMAESSNYDYVGLETRLLSALSAAEIKTDLVIYAFVAPTSSSRSVPVAPSVPAGSNTSHFEISD